MYEAGESYMYCLSLQTVFLCFKQRNVEEDMYLKLLRSVCIGGPVSVIGINKLNVI